MSAVAVGLSLMIEPDFLAATLPLFEADLVDVLEWSVDLGWGPQPIPDWAVDLLAEYSEHGGLYGHGVHFSGLSAAFQPRQQQWLDDLRTETKKRRYRMLSEHFGFSTVPGYRYGAPFPVPFCEGALAVGRARLAMLKEAVGAPVGLENLALAFNEREVWSQGAFLEELLRPVSGFLHLDAHNLHCQIENFGCDRDALLRSYPLERARVVHVSGGSWAEPRHGKIRQDTHDGAVPKAVLELVASIISLAPNVEAVIFERLGGTVRNEKAAQRLRADYAELREVVARAAKERVQEGGPRVASSPASSAHADVERATTIRPSPHDEAALAKYQATLLDTLCRGEDVAPRFAEQLPEWRDVTRDYEPRMLRLAARIASSYTRRDQDRA